MQAPYQEQPQASAFQYAGVGIRFLAALIDGIIMGVVIFLINRVLGTSGAYVGGLLALVYFIVMEAMYGATVGKMALGLKVVKEDGSAISWQESIIRNLLRIIDGLFAYLVGAIIIWTSPLKQRLGDKLAHTIVIKTR
ncbi:MAG TPA: RDD family protein [Ktedonosporobacter sp.]|nr:RDD family protein [Ktedonosporobacter sp.]